MKVYVFDLSLIYKYRESADKIGEVTSCSDTQMVEFATHAKTVYGSNVYNWTSIQITSVGAHIGKQICTLVEQAGCAQW
jgi:hypothetical protein